MFRAKEIDFHNKTKNFKTIFESKSYAAVDTFLKENGFEFKTNTQFRALGIYEKNIPQNKYPYGTETILVIIVKD